MTGVDKVATMFKQMEEDNKHAEIFKSMVFPDTSKTRETRESALVQCEYSCNDSTCDFSRCLMEIQTSTNLLKFRSREVCEEIVRDVKDHQEDFLPSKVDGYFLNRMGHELVHLKRAGSEGRSVTGYIEYNDLRKQSMDFYDIQKIKAINHIVDEALKHGNKDKGGQTGCAIM